MGQAFIVRRGGKAKLKLPEPIEAGDVVVRSMMAATRGTSSFWTEVETSRFTAKISGVYRIKYGFVHWSGYSETKLTKNGVDVAGSTIYNGMKAIDITLQDGDVLKQDCRTTDNGIWFTTGINVCIAYPELEELLTEI